MVCYAARQIVHPGIDIEGQINDGVYPKHPHHSLSVPGLSPVCLPSQTQMHQAKNIPQAGIRHWKNYVSSYRKRMDWEVVLLVLISCGLDSESKQDRKRSPRKCVEVFGQKNIAMAKQHTCSIVVILRNNSCSRINQSSDESWKPWPIQQRMGLASNKVRSLTLIWYSRSAETGQTTKIDRQKAIALPTPCLSACRKLKLSRTVSRYKCKAVVKMMRIKVDACHG